MASTAIEAARAARASAVSVSVATLVLVVAEAALGRAMWFSISHGASAAGWTNTAATRRSAGVLEPVAVGLVVPPVSGASSSSIIVQRG